MKAMLVLVIAVALSLPDPLPAQARASVVLVDATAFPVWSASLPGADTRTAVAVADGGPDGTLLGFVIGAALGVAAGYAFYDVMCEAVDNNCSDSRAGLLIAGGGLGGALGALIGSVVD